MEQEQKILIYDLINEFITNRTVYCSPKTIEDYKNKLHIFNKYVVYLRDFDEFTVRDFIIYERSVGVKNVSIRSYCRVIKAFSNWLRKKGYITFNPFDDMSMPRNDAAILRPLTNEEVSKIDSVCNARDKVIVHMMLDAGLRASEVCSLSKNDVSLVTNIIYVNCSKYNKSRLVPISPTLKNIIQEYMSEYDIIDNFLYSAKDAKSALTSNSIKLIFSRIKCKSGVERVHAHLLRHTFATSYMIGGGNLEILRILLGHSDYNVTRLYLHISAQYQIVSFPIYQLDDSFFKRGY